MLTGGNIWISVSPPAKYSSFSKASKTSSQYSSPGLGKLWCPCRHLGSFHLRNCKCIVPILILCLLFPLISSLTASIPVLFCTKQKYLGIVSLTGFSSLFIRSFPVFIFSPTHLTFTAHHFKPSLYNV